MRSKILLPLTSVFMMLFICSAPASYGDEGARIRVIATGGTIAGVAHSSADANYQASQVPVDALLSAIPELQQLAKVSGEQIFQVSSQDLSNAHLLQLANRVNTLLASSEVDGLVITHGTDTLEETAYFLNLVVASDKPIVLTGAMRASTSLSADGPLNLYNAVAVAADPMSKGKGVLVVLNDRILGARDVTKGHTTAADAFDAPNYGALGGVYYGQVRFYRTSTRKHTTQSEFRLKGIKSLPAIDIIYGHQHNSARAITAAVKANVAGIVSAGVGNGNQHQTTLEALAGARKKGLFVVRASRIPAGPVTLNAEVEDATLDFVVADNLSPQKARILLMLALTKTQDTAELQRIFFEY